MTDDEHARMTALAAEVALLRADMAALRTEIAALRGWQDDLEDGVRELLAKQR